MNNESESIYGLLVHSEEKGRGLMETAVYTTCILSVAVAILQFIAQPTPDPFAVFQSPPQDAPPIVSHHAVEVIADTKS